MNKLSNSERDAIGIIVQHPGLTASEIAPLIFVGPNAARALLTRLTRVDMVSRVMIDRVYRYTRATVERQGDE